MCKTYFAREDLKPDDFIDKNDWRSFIVTDSVDCDAVEHIENQSKLLDGLKDIIIHSDTKYLRDFLCFCTGLAYLPDVSVHTDFKITIEFNMDECDEESLPVAHTCVKTIKFPYQAYGGNKEKLKHKLGLSLTYSTQSFNIA
jgi:HECT-domain (ubiquitin-transferase)